MISMTKIFEFAAAHHLPHHKGLCKNQHGHTFRCEVTIAGSLQEEGAAQGMVMDFGELKRVVKTILSRYDHQNLNKKFENPTAEIMVQAIASRIEYSLQVIYQLTQFGGIRLVKVRLWESSSSYVTWSKE